MVVSEKVPHDISDHLINVFRNTSVDEFNSTLKTMKHNVQIENWKYDPEDILRIAELTYIEMIENGLWTGATSIQESGFVVNTTCWNCGGKGHRASDCPSKKLEELQLQEEIQFLIKVTSLEESGLLPGMVSLILRRSLESLTSTTQLPSAGTNKPRTFWEWQKLLLKLWTLNPQHA